ncbi:MAG: hypothetical protein OEW04_14840 [Nitrospirota bacterium]|nr:hypothetical protein [Nitrospirota bacterium]
MKIRRKIPGAKREGATMPSPGFGNFFIDNVDKYPKKNKNPDWESAPFRQPPFEVVISPIIASRQYRRMI